ncbi:MAG: hypothetical protein Q7T50_01135, partial [Candidatus Magasanikbacteria bacterium]|nr:hypothetical protein [Candidatus Magasanikbacteria bacterium]
VYQICKSRKEKKNCSKKEDMLLQSVIKLVIITVIFPVQVNLIELGDYLDAWEKLDEVVNVIVEQAGEDEQYVGDYVDIERQEEQGRCTW